MRTRRLRTVGAVGAVGAVTPVHGAVTVYRSNWPARVTGRTDPEGHTGPHTAIVLRPPARRDAVSGLALPVAPPGPALTTATALRIASDVGDAVLLGDTVPGRTRRFGTVGSAWAGPLRRRPAWSATAAPAADCVPTHREAAAPEPVAVRKPRPLTGAPPVVRAAPWRAADAPAVAPGRPHPDGACGPAHRRPRYGSRRRPAPRGRTSAPPRQPPAGRSGTSGICGTSFGSRTSSPYRPCSHVVW